MLALITLLVIIAMSLTAVRIGAIALELTVLSPEIASFQAQSAFSGTGFTTTESESLVAHPVRRRIIRVLILFGGAGVTTSIAALVITFIGQTGHDLAVRMQILLLGVAVLYLIARSKYVYRLMRIIIGRALKYRTKIRIFDYEQILGLSEGYCISRVAVKHNSFLKDKKLHELKLEQVGMIILAIYRKAGKREKFIGGVTGLSLIHI